VFRVEEAGKDLAGFFYGIKMKDTLSNKHRFGE